MKAKTGVLVGGPPVRGPRVYCRSDICCTLCEWDAIGEWPISGAWMEQLGGDLVRFFELRRSLSSAAAFARMEAFHRHDRPLTHRHRRAAWNGVKMALAGVWAAFVPRAALAELGRQVRRLFLGDGPPESPWKGGES